MALPSPARALLLDMDGLMVDSEPLWWRVEHALAAEHGLAWTDELASQCTGQGLASAITRMRREIGLEVTVEEGVRWLVAAFLTRLDELSLMPGCGELLDAARAASIPLAVASSSTRPLIDGVLRRFSLAPRFHAIVSGEDVARPKPAPDIFARAAESLAVDPSSAVVLEDSVAGVTASVAAGIPVIAVPERDRGAFAPLTPYVVSDLFEARTLLGL